MADNNTTIESLRSELESLRSQMENMVRSASAKGQDTAQDLAARIAHELKDYRHKAEAGAEKLRHYGQTGMDEVGDQVRKNPLVSLAIAFGAGCIVSCLFRHLR